jgi:hypothetical protein
MSTSSPQKRGKSRQNKKTKRDDNMKTIVIDQTYLRIDSEGFYKLDIPEKLNMARLMVNLSWIHTKHS